MKKAFALVALLALGIQGTVYADYRGDGYQGSKTRLNTLSVYAAGTAYSLTNTAAAVDMGTTDPSLTITRSGTWLIFGRARLKYNAATFAANQTATVKLRRTNNTAADVTGATTTATLRIITTITDGAAECVIPPVLYTTSNTDDAIAIFGNLSAAPGAGSVDVTEAEIVAIKVA